jgi:hypothetical protein
MIFSCSSGWWGILRSRTPGAEESVSDDAKITARLQSLKRDQDRLD